MPGASGFTQTTLQLMPCASTLVLIRKNKENISLESSKYVNQSKSNYCFNRLNLCLKNFPGT